MSHHQKFPCQNQSKSFEAFLANHFTGSKPFHENQILPLFVKIQLNPVLTDFRGPTGFICYSRNSVITKIGKDQELVAVTGGIPLKAGPLERGSTVLCFCSLSVKF